MRDDKYIQDEAGPTARMRDASLFFHAFFAAVLSFAVEWVRAYADFVKDTVCVEGGRR